MEKQQEKEQTDTAEAVTTRERQGPEGETKMKEGVGQGHTGQRCMKNQRQLTDRQTAFLGILSKHWEGPERPWFSASASSCCPWCCLQGPGGEASEMGEALLHSRLRCVV